MANGAKVLVVGWDGVDGATVDALIEEGALPNLARLRFQGSSGALQRLPGLADDATWSSFATMAEPGVHGRYHHHQPVAGGYRSAPFGRDAMTMRPFWDDIARAGRHVAVLDVPKSPMGHHANLRELVDWMPHGADHDGPSSSDAATAREVLRRFRRDRTFRCHRVLGPDEAAPFAASVRRRLGLRQELALEWLNQEAWDLFLVVFAEGHCAGHHCWHLHDTTHPAHDAGQRDRDGDPVREIYQAQDAALGDLMEAAGAGVEVVVFSPMGMGPNYSGERFIEPVLRRLEGLPEIAHAVESEASWRFPVLRRLLGDERAFAKRRYYALSHDAVSSAVRLNLAGREPAGVISSGAAFERECDTLTETLLALYDPSSGRRAVREVVRVAEQYPGPHSERFADLLIVWANEAPLEAVASDSLGRIKVEARRERSGNHRGDGWYTAGGSTGFAKQVPQSVVEMGAAIGALLGVSMTAERGQAMVAPV